jgi:hypothetical protein
VLPIRAKRLPEGIWDFEWDEDALVAQAKVWLTGTAALISAFKLLAHAGFSMFVRFAACFQLLHDKARSSTAA